MSLPEWLDPFAELTQSAYARIFYAKRREREAEARFRALIKTYKTLLQDTRYGVIAQDVEATLGQQLTRLVDAGKRCTCAAGCASLSERISLLQEIVGEPLQMVWTEAHRPKEDPELTELAPGNGRG